MPDPRPSPRQELPEASDRSNGPTAEPMRRPWVEPAVEELPRLTDLTLQTGGPIPGGGNTGGGGSTVF